MNSIWTETASMPSFPPLEGDTLLLGGGSHRTGKPTPGWEPLETFGRKHYPEARETARWAAQDCITLDEMPYIGRYGRRTEHLYVTTGFGKWGMTSAMAGAVLLRDDVGSCPADSSG